LGALRILCTQGALLESKTKQGDTRGVLRFFIGLLKGGILGGAVGYGAFTLGLEGGMHWVTYGVIGALVGLLVGKPFWVHLRERGSTVVTPIIKAVFGYGMTVGIYALVAKAWGGFDLEIAEETRRIYDWQYIMGAFVGGLYGGFVQVDDSPESSTDKPAAKQTS
jgi:hypothetical protein